MKVLFAGGNGYYPAVQRWRSIEYASSGRAIVAIRAMRRRCWRRLFGQGDFRTEGARQDEDLGQRAAVDCFPGYPVVGPGFPGRLPASRSRGSSPTSLSSSATNRFRSAKRWKRKAIPSVVYLRNVEFHELAGDLRELNSALYIANSEFTARTYKESFGIHSTIIPPTIDPALRHADDGRICHVHQSLQRKGF